MIFGMGSSGCFYTPIFYNPTFYQLGVTEMGNSTISILRRLPSEASRILKLSKKPTRSEFEEVVKITGMGIVVLGATGLIFILIRAFLEGRL